MSEWQPYEAGSTLGMQGSEGGAILRDEEHPLGGRITLERETLRGVPFAITCGIYGWMVHTRFIADEPTALHDYEAMKGGLERILSLIPDEENPDVTDTEIADAADRVTEAVATFVEQYP